MKTYLALFKPLEPYFFGGEKVFTYFDAETNEETDGSTYIKSETLISQSTVLGALRYLFLPVKKADWGYSEAEACKNAETVGESSFTPEEKRSFGKIKSISPVFLNGPKGIYVPTPFDHKTAYETYSPFRDYKEVETEEGRKLVAREYTTKDGVTDSYMALSDGTVVPNDQLFFSVLQPGINAGDGTYGFYKREQKSLHEAYSFGVYVTVCDDLLVPEQEFIFAGQKKSMFSVTFKEEENRIAEQLRPYLRNDVVYCFGDSFLERFVYQNCLFAVTKLKTYRAFSNHNKKITKGAKLYRLITAGSVFVTDHKEVFLESVKNEIVEDVGYNHFITK